MNYSIDLTNVNFNRIDFSEAQIIDFCFKKDLPDKFEFTVWGATILLSSFWQHEKNFLLGYEEDMYVSGVGTIKMTNLVGGSIEVYAYDNIKDEQNRTILAKNLDGSVLVHKKQWTTRKSDSVSQEYFWECVFTWPYGFCNLRLFCCGPVTFEFDIDNLIPAKEYLKSPMLYAFVK